MKNLLLGIIAINLTFISALAWAEDPSDIFDDTSGKITATVGEGEESDEGEDSLGELPDDADTDNLEITVSDDEGDPE